jgi:hypothetical protein
LVIDTRSGRIAYAVLSYGGVLGVGEKLFAVPWPALTLNVDKKMFVLSVDKDKLKNAPGFDSDKWPDMNDLRWSKDVHAFYGSDPNWIYGYTGAGESAGTSRGWGLNDQYHRAFKKDSIQTVEGSIGDMRKAAPMSGMDEAAMLNLQTDKETIPVHLGPAWFIERQDRQFNQGERIKVTGSRVELNGKAVIIATEVERGNDTLRLREKNGRPCWVAWHDND